MSSYQAISAEKLSRLVGTPQVPLLIDVRTNEDFAADPRLVPGSSRRPHAAAADWAAAYRGRQTISRSHVWASIWVSAE